MKKLKTIFIMSSILGSLLLTTTPALADDSTISFIDQLKPGLLQETSTSNQFEVTKTTSSVEFDPKNSGDQKAADLPMVSISTDSTAISNLQGLVIVRDAAAETASVFQPTATGGRIMTVIKTSDSAHCSKFAFDVPQGTTLETAAEGYYLENGSDVILHLSDAWAVDSNGKEIPSKYSWDSGTLTQCVAKDVARIQYPILADPGWDYTYQYALTKTAATNKIYLKSCFNCYFPVTGAPQGFPVPQQLLPLSTSFFGSNFNMECRFDAEFNGTNYYGFSFLATANHVDGIGSWILFEMKTVSGAKKLIVSAHVMNDLLKVGPYSLGAQGKWQDFANNLNK